MNKHLHFQENFFWHIAQYNETSNSQLLSAIYFSQGRPNIPLHVSLRPLLQFSKLLHFGNSVFESYLDYTFLLLVFGYLGHTEKKLCGQLNIGAIFLVKLCFTLNMLLPQFLFNPLIILKIGPVFVFYTKYILQIHYLITRCIAVILNKRFYHLKLICYHCVVD